MQVKTSWFLTNFWTMKHFIITLLLCVIFFYKAESTTNSQKNGPVRIGIIGLTHTHVHWIFNSAKRGKITIVGIVEPDEQLAIRYAKQYKFPMEKLYKNIAEMLQHEDPEGVAAFGTIAEHLQVVEACAPKGIHVMVEKPLAIDIRQAKKMQALAEKYNIDLLVNYETSWYPTVQKAKTLLGSDSIGSLVQIIIRDGHRGPKNIGVNSEFLNWLTDPKQNGGGAIMDFGCYGANIATWMLNGKRPQTVTAVTQQLQKENNPLVDDESTIILTYDNCKVTIQASWNWPIGRKDMEVYGRKGVIYADNRNSLRVRIAKGYDGYDETTAVLNEMDAPHDDPFTFFAAVIRKQISIPDYDLSSLENGLLVQEILDAARLSSETGKTVKLK